MEAYSLGPNGGMLYCLEYLEKNIEWLEDELERAMAEMGWVGDRREEAYVIFDTPGQVELSTDHGSLRRIVDRLAKKGGWRVRVCFLQRAPARLGGGGSVLTASRAACSCSSDGRSPHHGRVKICCPPAAVSPDDAADGAPPRQRPE